MRNQQGTLLVFGVAAALGLAGASETPGSTATQAPRVVAAAAAAESATPSGTRLLAEFLGMSDGQVASRMPQLDARFLFATVADPHASQLDWVYDGQLDAMRQAMESAGYVFDRHALPWVATPATAHPGGLPAQFGVVLFRRASTSAPSDVLLLYLIGEVPTGGIDKPALAAALAEWRRLNGHPGADRTIRLIGPTFSGSSPSLRRALEQGSPERSYDRVRIVSGSATSPDNATTLTRASDPQIDYSTTVHTDDVLLARLAEIVAHLGLADTEVAVLQEATTGYGADLQTVATAALGTHYLRIRFPMQIAALRRATRTEPALAPTSLPGGLASAVTELDLRTARDTSELPAVQSNVTPPTIDLLIEDITRSLAQHGVRLVLLQATDVRDKLFLARELKKRRPDLQLATTESNALFARAEFNPWLRGMLVLASDPLLAPISARGVFPNDGAAGAFRAVQLHFTEMQPPDGTPAPTHPPLVWTTVVGAGAMLPLAASPAQDRGTTKANATAASHHGRTGFLLDALALLLIAAVVCMHVASRRRTMPALGKAPQPQDWSDRHSHILAVSLSLHHQMYRAVSYGALLGMLAPTATLLVCAGDHGWFGVPQFGAALAAALFLFHAWVAVMIATRHANLGLRHALWETWRSPSARYWWGVEFALRLSVAVLALAYVGLVACLCHAITRLDRGGDENSPFMLFLRRSLELDQGVTVLVPLTLISLIVAAWSHWHVRRTHLLAAALTPGKEQMLGSGQSGAFPVPPFDPLGTPAEGDQSAGSPPVWNRLFLILPRRSESLLILLGLNIAAIAGCGQFQNTLDGVVLPRLRWFETSAFDLLLCSGIVAALAAAVWACYRVVSVWRGLTEGLAEVRRKLPDLPLADVLGASGRQLELLLPPADRAQDLRHLSEAAWRRLAEHDQTPEPIRTPAPSHNLLRQIEDLLAQRSEPSNEWRALAARCVAVEQIRMIDWTLRPLRHLCVFLLISVVLTTLLVSSYPYQPQRLVQTVGFLVFVGVIATLVWLIGAINRNPTMSAISGTAPGQLTWDRTLYQNLVLFVLPPVVTLVSAQFPALRKLLFDWVEPTVRFLLHA